MGPAVELVAAVAAEPAVVAVEELAANCDFSPAFSSSRLATCVPLSFIM